MNPIFVRLFLATLVLALAACAQEPAPEPEAAPPTPADAGPPRSIVNLTGDLYRGQNNLHHNVFLVTEEGIIMTDPIDRDYATWLKAELDSRFGVPVRYVLYSHSHWDHASGGEVFADTAEFIGHENMTEALMVREGVALPENAAAMDANGNGTIEPSEATGNFQNNFALFDANADGMLSGGEVARGPVSDVYPPNETYSDRTTITLGGKTAEMIHPGTQHAADMSVIYFPEESAVFVVDFLNLRLMPFQTLPGLELEPWLEQIRFVEAMNAEIAAPGHGEVGTTADVAEARQYLEGLRDGVAEAMAAGMTLEQMQESITFEAYSDWGFYEEWLPLNIQGMYNMLSE